MRKTAVVLVALALALGGVAAQPSKAGAEVGQWNYYPATGHWYVQTEPMTWLDAEAYAHTVGGNLVTINDQAEQDWLETTFTDKELLIGMTDQWSEGSWHWSSGEPVTYTNWSTGEPNDNEGNEDVAVMNWLHAEWPGPDPQPLGWNDLPTTAVLGAIVEVRRDPTHHNNGAATQFTMAYGDTVCTGVRVANKNMVRDNEACTRPGINPFPGTYRGNPTGTLPPFGDNATWHSDFDGRLATSWLITIVNNADGTNTGYIHATY